MPKVSICSPEFDWLKGREFDVHSQFGEDGLIEAALAKFGEANRCCFEVGASDGVTLSNTKKLRDAGWRAVLIDCDDTKWDALQTHASELVVCIKASIAAASLDLILAQANLPLDLDFGSIDIDGMDYWILDGLRLFRPRLLLVEFGRAMPDYIPEADDVGSPERQAGLNSIIAKGREKGYVPMAVTHVNVLFVDGALCK